MTIDLLTFSTILGMALVTYLTRAGGVLLIGRSTAPRITLWLRHLPGSILVALIAPLILSGGVPTLVAAGVTAVVAAHSRHLLLALLAGVGTVWLLRQLI